MECVKMADHNSSNSAADKRWDIIKTEDGKKRISQLCDRCCIKKIKCDGTPGGCSNCLNIGFFCKTTDKLTRASYPKGYTKTLEKQVVELMLVNSKMQSELDSLRVKQEERDLEILLQQDDGSLGTSILTFVNSMRDDDFFQFEKTATTKLYLKKDMLSFNQRSLSHMQDHVTRDLGLELDEEVVDEVYIGDDFNLLLLRYIKPLLYKDPSLPQSILNDNRLDNLISKYFDYHNKLIPVLDYKNFYNEYLNFFNKFKIDNDVNFRFDFNEQDKIFIIKLLLVIKFNFNDNSIFNYDNQFHYTFFTFSQFEKLIAQNVNFLDLDISRFELILLSLLYLNQFEIPNQELYGNKRWSDWSYKLLSMGLHYLNSLALNISSDELITDIDDKELLIHYNFVRTKLYWSFRALLRSTKIKFNYQVRNLKLSQEQCSPDTLTSFFVLEEDLKYTLEYLNLIKLIPINFYELSQYDLHKVEQDLMIWKENFVSSKLYCENTGLSRKLLMYFYQYKYVIDKDCAKDIIQTGYQLLDHLLRYEIKPKVTRGRKKRNYEEMMAKQKLELKVDLLSKLANLSDYENLLINDKLSILNSSLKNLLLIACLSEASPDISTRQQISQIYTIFEIGIYEKSIFQQEILNKIKATLSPRIDVSKELNEIHQTFTMVDSESIPSPSSLSSGNELSIAMSRTSSISTNSQAQFMSRTPSLSLSNEITENDEDRIFNGLEQSIKVQSLFGNYKKDSFAHVQSEFLYSRDEDDLQKLKLSVIEISR